MQLKYDLIKVFDADDIIRELDKAFGFDDWLFILVPAYNNDSIERFTNEFNEKECESPDAVQQLITDITGVPKGETVYIWISY